MICYHFKRAMGVQKWRFLQKLKECHVTVAAQLRLHLVIYKVMMWVQGFRAMAMMKGNSVS